MPQRTPRPKTVYRRWIAEIEAPLHALVRSELQLGSTTAARNLIKGGSVRVSDEQVKIPSTIVKVGQEISAPESKEERKLERADAPKSIRPADEMLYLVNGLGLVTVLNQLVQKVIPNTK